MAKIEIESRFIMLKLKAEDTYIGMDGGGGGGKKSNKPPDNTSLESLATVASYVASSALEAAPLP